MVQEIIELLFCLFAFPFSSCWHTCLYCCCSCCLSCNSMCCCSLRISSSCWSWVLCKISANWSRSISNWRMEADSESTYKSKSTKFHCSNACKGILLAFIQTPPPPPIPSGKKNGFFLRGGKGVLYRGYIPRAESRVSPELRQAFKVTDVRTSGLVNLVLYYQTDLPNANIRLLINRWS